MSGYGMLLCVIPSERGQIVLELELEANVHRSQLIR